MLSDRRQIVLRALIEEYIARALPVGSRTLVERYNLGISSATVRNELSLLEEMGYLAQPHTSAGRIPTDFGYRAFVDELLSESDPDNGEDALARELRESASDLDDLMDRTSQALARFTDCMTLLVPPRILSVDIRLVNLVLLTPQRLLTVIVTEDGQVFDRQMDLPRDYSQDEIGKSQEALNNILIGTSLSSTSGELPLGASGVHDDLFRMVMAEILACLKDQNAIKAHPLGISHLLGKPEFSDSSCLMPVLEELEGDTMLLRVFNDAAASEEPVVRIGHENDSEALSSVSLIANRFGEAEHSGLILIVGPTRMDYSQVLKAVRAARNVLKDL
ncbi:MAG: heat-inducible transcriptional repressor HrcA [Eggerthellaceae bacterium]|nr:heat-inducible transcriptional repressor HrcA [Eggerthellaceae bacterium]